MDKLFSPADIINAGLCIGCGSCVAQAGNVGVTMQFDKYAQLVPQGDQEWLNTPSAEFTQTCPFSPEAANENVIAAEEFKTAPRHDDSIGRFSSAYVGYAAEQHFRLQGSSGGMVTWVANELLKRGLIDGVAHVIPVDPDKENRFFKYRISRTSEEIMEGAKSRYYPVELSEIVTNIRNVPGRYAVVGIPCFIKSIQLLRRQDPVLQERIAFTLGLFCGHMKSARFVESFAWQLSAPIKEVCKVEFRYKDPGRPANWYKAMLTLKNGNIVDRDWWHLADGDWGSGFFMNSACNFCDDIVAETADISFGDAWVEPYSSDGKGTNVIVVRSATIQQLIDKALSERRLQLTEVDAAFIHDTQAAGFRQRREGLAYRLSLGNKGIQPCKRVLPSAKEIPKRRRLIYRMRRYISHSSHRMFYIARLTHQPWLYIRWAATATRLYHGLAYQQGKIGKMLAFFRLKS